MIQHSPGPFRVGKEEWGEIPIWDAEGHRVAGTKDILEGYPYLGNAELLALAPTSLHDCELRECSGSKIKAQREAAEKLLEKAQQYLGSVDFGIPTAASLPYAELEDAINNYKKAAE